MSHLDITTARLGDVELVELHGRLDAQSAGQAKEQVDGLLAGGCKLMLLNLTGVNYISSAGLRMLLHLAKSLQEAQGRLALCGLQPYVDEVFEVAGFTSIFEIHRNQEAGLRALRGN